MHTHSLFHTLEHSFTTIKPTWMTWKWTKTKSKLCWLLLCFYVNVFVSIPWHSITERSRLRGSEPTMAAEKYIWEKLKPTVFLKRFINTNVLTSIYPNIHIHWEYCRITTNKWAQSDIRTIRTTLTYIQTYSFKTYLELSTLLNVWM